MLPAYQSDRISLFSSLYYLYFLLFSNSRFVRTVFIYIHIYMQFAAVFCDWPLPTQLPRCGKSFSFILEYMIYATYIALYIYMLVC